MAYAAASKAAERKFMWVQLPLPVFFNEAKINRKWNSNLAYAIGLIATDGNLSKDKRHILFTTTDRQLANTFKKCLDIKNKRIANSLS